MTPIPKPPIRWRSNTANRRYDPTRRIELSEMRVDRLAVRVDAEIRYPSRDVMTAYIAHLNGTNFLPFTLFRVSAHPSPHKRKVSIIRNRTLEHEAFLLAGEGELGNVAQDGGTARLSLNLSLNPTRWLAHQEVPFCGPGIDLETISALPAYQRLEQRPDLAVVTALRALDGNDNLLIGFGRTSPGLPTMDVVRVYLGAVWELLAEALDPGEAIPGVTVTLRTPTVTQVEAYAEQGVEDAICAMATLADRLTVASTDMAVCHHLPANRIAIGNTLNARSVTLHVARNIDVAVYAKTMDRVRFEVRFKDDVRAVVARHLHGDVGPLEIIEAAMKSATDRLGTINEALGQLMQDAPVDWANLADFMADLLWACDGDRTRARALLAPLLIDQGVTETVPGGLAPRAVMQRLRARGVVQRVRVQHGGHWRWALTPPHAAVMRTLGDQLPDRRRLRELQGVVN